MSGPIGFGFGSSRSAVAISDKGGGAVPAVDEFAKALTATYNHGATKVNVKEVAMSAVASVTMRLWNIDTGAQVGPEMTKGPAALVGSSSNATTFNAQSLSAGTNFRYEYKSDTSASGFKDVTAWTSLGNAVYSPGGGDVVQTPSIAEPTE